MTQAMEEERSTDEPLEVVDAGLVRVWSDDAGVVHVAAGARNIGMFGR